MNYDDMNASPSFADDVEKYFDEWIWMRDNKAEIVAALHTIEVAREFPKLPEDCLWQICGKHGVEGLPPCARCKAYREGVEAVQALLEGKQ